MEWIKWHEDNLPPPNERVLIAYADGMVGAIEFFTSHEEKEIYLEGLKWIKENNCRDDLNTMPIGWMMCPKAPKWKDDRDGLD